MLSYRSTSPDVNSRTLKILEEDEDACKFLDSPHAEQIA